MKAADADTFQLWPLVVVVCDGYMPALAPLVLEVVSEWDEEVCGLVIGLASMKAQDERSDN